MGDALSAFSPAQQADVDRALAELRQFLDSDLDPEDIDRKADIPRHVIDGLGRVGVLGMTAPKEVGGRGFSQMAYCKVLEEIGAAARRRPFLRTLITRSGFARFCFSARRSNRRNGCRRLMNGEQLAAFALTEREAGSDAANVQMTGDAKRRRLALTF